MKYYALFLDTKGYIEKCLTLIRFICNPSSKSLPHITMRVFKENKLGIDSLSQVTATYLNLFEVDNFNIEEQTPPYVVFIRCESHELEAQEYKPDFPQSLLHITLYKGNDLNLAQRVYQELNNMQWNIRLTFTPPKRLVQQNVGDVTVDEPFRSDIDVILKDILGESIDLFTIDNDYRIELIKKIIEKLKQYRKNSKVEEVKPLYCDTIIEEDCSVYDSQQDKFEQLSLDRQEVIEHPVENAIFITPPEYAQEMAKCALRFFAKDSPIYFGDSSIGTGSLYLALLNCIEDNTRIKSAIGIDIDYSMVKEANKRFNSRRLKVKHKDALLLDEQSLESKRNFMLVNPPYNRSQQIPHVYREQIFEIAKRDTGICIPKEASLYVYHLLIMDKWLAENGIAAWLLPSTFLQTHYGNAVKDYLVNNVTLLRIHVYDESKQQFDKTNVSTTLVVFRKGNATANSTVETSHGVSAVYANTSNIPLALFQKEKMNWRQIIFNNNVKIAKSDCQIGDLFDIKRGIATGANSFFVLSREQAKNLGIPAEALKPILPKARYINTTIIESEENGFPRLTPQLVLIDCDYTETHIKDNFPAFYNYLQIARLQQKSGKRIIDRTLVKARNPWYKQESRLPPTYLLTYMGRDKKNLPPLYFLLNKSNAIALNTYLLLYPKDWLSEQLKNNPGLDEKLLKCLNTSAYKYISNSARVYSGALKKLEPNELKKIPISDWPKLIHDYITAV